jgi:hypothetical protein
MNLKTWLSDPKRSYADGVELLKALKHKKLAFFQAEKDPKPESYHFRLLVSILQNEARKKGQQPSSNQEVPLIKVTSIPLKDAKKPSKTKGKETDPPSSEDSGKDFRIVDLDLIDIRELPEELAEDFKTIKLMTPEIGKLHAALKVAKDDKTRKEISEDLVAAESQRAHLWEGINEWYKTRPATTEATDSEEDKKRIADEAAKKAIQKVKRIDTLKINIARAIKEIKSKKLSAAKVKSREEKLIVWQKELEDLEKQ